MKNILHFSKALKIIFIFSRRGILSKVADNNLFTQRALFFINIINFFIGKEIPNNLVGSTLVNILKNLGPAFVKLGQALATRPDIVGVELANELAQLHDKMEAFSFEKIEKSIKVMPSRKYVSVSLTTMYVTMQIYSLYYLIKWMIIQIHRVL